jgi:hypothetical protein
MKVKLLIVFVGLLFGNCFFELLTKQPPDWLAVFEHSYFQGWALITYWITNKIFWEVKE